MQTATEYTASEATRTLTEARALAREELEAQLQADGAGRTLLQKSVELSVCEDGVTLHCTVVCEEDIASVSEFELHP